MEALLFAIYFFANLKMRGIIRNDTFLSKRRDTTMAESMQGLHRSHRCTEVSNTNIGEKVTVMGWVQKRRNLGSLIFVDLRDRSGILQLVFDEESVGSEGFEKAGSLRSEFVIAVK